MIELRAAQSMGAKTNFTVVGEAADNAATYARTVDNIGSRPTTQASVPWTPEPWSGGTTYATAELKTLLQEVVNRPGWQTGNAAAFVVTGTYTRRAAAFDAGLHEVRAPRLVVTYTTADTPPPPPPPSTNTCDALSGTLPQPWTSADVGTVGTAGKAAFAEGVFDLCGAGAGVGGAGDAFHFVSQPLQDNGTFTARLTGLDAAGRAGVMVRESLAANSQYGAVLANGATPSFQQRSVASTVAGAAKAFVGIKEEASSESAAAAAGKLGLFDSILKVQATPLEAPLWLRVTRSGDTLTGYSSADGETWQQTGSATVVMPAAVKVGLFATSQGAETPLTARFDNVALGPVVGEPSDPPPPPTNPCDTLSGIVPAPWESADLGTVGTAGKAAFAEDVFELCGYGDGLGGAADSLHLVQQTLTGDGTLTARLTGLDAATPQAQAGVIVRETTAPDAPYAALSLDGANNTAFVNRGGTAATTAVSGSVSSIFGQVQGVAGGDGGAPSVFGQIGNVAGTLAPQANLLTAPVWLRLTRESDLLSGFTSADGETWTAAGTVTLTMAQPVSVGLFATSQGDAAPATARFDNVTLGSITKDDCAYLFDGSSPSSSTSSCESVGSGQVGTEGGLVRTGAGNDNAFAQVYPGFLDAMASVSISNVPRPTTFPGEFATNYPADELTTIAEAVEVTLPGSAINFADEDNFVGIYVPPNAAYDPAANNIYELHISSSELSEPFLYFDYYSADEAVAIRTDLLKALFGGTATDDVTIVIQPVSIDAGTPQGQQLSTQNVVYANYIEGLYSISDDDSFAAIFDDACPSGPGTARQSVPSVASGAISLEEGKTPLVLVHGWQGVSSNRTLKGTFFPGLCTWPTFAKNFMNSENTVLKSPGLDMLKEKYQLFVFSYDSSQGVTENAIKLKEKLAAFGGTPAVVLAHSMGGIVSNAALNDGAPIKHLMTLGTPFRGSPALVCIKASATQCDQARLNRDVIIRTIRFRTGLAEDARRFLAAAQFRILQGQGGKDLSWEYPGYIGQPNSPADLTLTICRVLNRICQADYYFGGKGNPKLHALNEVSAFSKHTSYYGVGSDLRDGFRLISQALQDSTGHQNDLIVPIQSACASNQMNDCAGSKLKGLMAYPKLGHEDIKEDEGILAAVTAQLLRLANDTYAYDIDDGTPDGNQRLLIGTVSSPGVVDDTSEVDGVVDMLLPDEPLEYSGTDFGFIFGGERYGEDADQNEVFGDGRIGMEDFRRWRDWTLKSEGKGFFDGSPQHVKRDMNGGGVFPRWGDFNGDGEASSSLRFQVPYIPGTDGNPTTETLSDLEVMMRVAKVKNLWADPDYALDDLPNLVDSGDIEVFIRDLYSLPEAIAVNSYIVNLNTGGTLVGQQLHSPADPRRVYTLPSGEYLALIYVDGLDGHTVLKMQKRFTVTVGSDHIWGPTANLVADVKPSYMGIAEDCPLLQGTYSVDIKGVFDGASPDFPMLDDNVGLEIDDEYRTFRLLEREKLANDPLEIFAATLPSCNLPEGVHDLRLNYNYFEAPDGNGFAVDFGGTVDNADNRFPGRVWNSTDLSPFEECPPFSTTMTVDGNGDPTQNLFAAPGTADDGFIRTGYPYDFRYYADMLVEQNTMYVPPYEQDSFIIYKSTYRGESAWWFNNIRIVSCVSAAQQSDLRSQSQESVLLDVQPLDSIENESFLPIKPIDRESW